MDFFCVNFKNFKLVRSNRNTWKSELCRKEQTSLFIFKNTFLMIHVKRTFFFLISLPLNKDVGEVCLAGHHFTLYLSLCGFLRGILCKSLLDRPNLHLFPTFTSHSFLRLTEIVQKGAWISLGR